MTLEEKRVTKGGGWGPLHPFIGKSEQDLLGFHGDPDQPGWQLNDFLLWPVKKKAFEMLWKSFSHLCLQKPWNMGTIFIPILQMKLQNLSHVTQLMA